MALDDLGLVAAVAQFVHQLHERGLVSVSMTVEGIEAPLDAHVKAALFRIIQESLSNIAHHAEAKNASLRMLYTDAAVSILIEDNGKGFDAESAMEHDASGEGHFGLLGMRERAMIIGAQFVVTSKPGQGTRVHVRFPLRPEDAPQESSKEAAERKRLPRKRVLHEVPSVPEDELTAEVMEASRESAESAVEESAPVEGEDLDV